MSEPPYETNAAEIKKSYLEAITRAARFLISSAIILFILIVIVGQELREYRTKQASFAKQIKTTVDQKKSENTELDRSYRRICEGLPKTTKGTVLSRANIGDGDKAAFRAIAAPEFYAQFESDDVLTQPRFDVAFEALIDRCNPRPARQSQLVKTQIFPRRTSGVRTQTDLDALARDEQKLGALIEILKQEQKKGEPKERKNQTQNSEPPIQQIVAYRDSYRRIMDLSRDLLNLTKETKSLNAAKNSIPTPFGNFQIAPRLALLGLAYATLLAYLSFLGSVRKIRTLADRHSRATGEKFLIPAPLWSPNPPSESRSDLTSLWARLISIVIHVIWLLTAAWLVFESVSTWNAPKALAFEYKPFWGYLLLGLLLITVLVAVLAFLPASFKRVVAAPAESDGQPRLLTARRVFIGVSAVAVLGLLTLGVRRFLAETVHTWKRHKLAEFTSAPDPEIWIQNKQKNRRKPKIVHFKEICGRHLPSFDNRLQAFEGDQLVHAACQVRIFQALGMNARDKMLREVSQKRTDPETPDKLTEEGLAQARLAIEYFEKAIALSPLSLHLHDRLRNVYGTLGRYENIKKLLDDSLKKVQEEAKLARSDGNVKRQHALHRAEEAFKLRLQATETRRTNVAKWKEEKEKGVIKQHPNKQQ